jgi:V8-like Glu-specific endopeptidase
MALPAVGLIRATGAESVVICTGTLVASDLVVTSAHCTDKSKGLLKDIEFIAGLNGTRFLANRGVVEVIRHPNWDRTTGMQKFRYDVAVLRLARPIMPERVTPLRVLPMGKNLPADGALVGYRATEVKLLYGRFDCAFAPASTPALFSSDCPASEGNSGGAVLVDTENGLHLAGVIVASSQRADASVAAEFDHWLYEQVDAALGREAQRSAKVE